MASVLTPGTILRARYRIDRVIHETHLVNIYYAHDTHMKGKSWAVREMKLIAEGANEKSALISKFKREAGAIASISHPMLASVVDFFTEYNYLYLVREYVQGLDLSTRLAKQMAPFKEDEVISWSVQLADLLNFLYLKKVPPIFFREFNMGNLVAEQSGIIKVTDIGVAKIFYSDTNLEHLGHLGASEYAAPEQFDGSGIFDMRSLVYSLGAFMYHALTNVNPSVSPFDLQPPSLLNPTLSRSVQDIIKKATDPDPKKRFQTLQDMKKSLSLKIKDLPAGKKPNIMPLKPSGDNSSGFQNVLFFVTVTVLLSLLGFLGYYFFIR